MELGFTEDDIAEIQAHFEYWLDLSDWKKSVMLFENGEELLRHLYIDNQDRDSLINTLLEMSEIEECDLKEDQSVLGYMVEGDDSIFKLSNGRWVIFSSELLGKEARQQMD